MNYLLEFKKELEEFLDTEYIYLFWKGRVALYAILKALGIGKEDEVIVPAFTCVVVPNAVIYLGAKPVYVDIDRNTFNIDPNKIEERITDRTKAILVQNTFGLSADIERVKSIASRYGLWVIEDCAHGFGSRYKGKKSGTVADASFFSTQWNKPFSTGLGGIAVTRKKELADRLKEIEDRAIKPSKAEEYILKALIAVRERLLSSRTYWMALKTYRFLSQKNLIIGSSQGYELEKPKMPQNFLKGFSETQAKEGLKYFERVGGKYRIDLLIEHRKKVASLYREALKELGVSVPAEPEYAEHSYLRFPLLVRNRDRFLKKAQEQNIEVGDWFLSPIHPIEDRFELWNYRYGENPIGEFASRHIVNLPTHQGIGEKEVSRIVKFLNENREEIIGCHVPEEIG